MFLDLFVVYMNTEYIRQHLEQNYSIDIVTDSLLSKIEDNISTVVEEEMSSSNYVDPELCSILQTLKEYLQSIYFSSFYKNRYIKLPKISAREIDRLVRERESDMGVKRGELTSINLRLTDLFSEEELANLQQIGEEIIGMAQDRLTILMDSSKNQNQYRSIDVWLGICLSLVKQNNWRKLGQKYTTIPVSTVNNTFKEVNLSEIWNSVTEMLDISDSEDPISVLSKFTESSTIELYRFFDLTEIENSLV